jgi:hypothetical protein
MQDILNTVVIDNVLPQELADKIESIFRGNEFPWYYIPDITFHATEYKGNDRAGETFGFSHELYHYKKGIVTSDIVFDIIRDIPGHALVKNNLIEDQTKVNIDNYTIATIKSFFQPPNGNTRREYDNKHNDTDVPHLVCLYYVLDASGDTFFFGKEKESELAFTVTPKKNRALLFDGRYYHASSSPYNGPRIVINFNLFHHDIMTALEEGRL